MTTLKKPRSALFRMKQIVRLLSLGFVIPFVMNVVVYFGFCSNYTGGVFSEAGFRNQYESGIFKYRILGNATLLKINDILEDQDLPGIAPRALFILDPNASPRFYLAYFLNNTLFFCLTSFTLLFLIDKNCTRDQLWIGDFSVMLLCSLIAITQYTIVPYDTMSYFFLVLGFYLTYGDQNPFRMLSLGLVVVLGILARESSILIVAFYIAVHNQRLFRKRLQLSIWNVTLIFLVLCVAGTYLTTRLLLRSDQLFFHDFLLFFNLTHLRGQIGLLFLLGISTVLLLDGPGGRESVVFLLASLPYLIFVFVTGIAWETRLWIPIFLALIVLKICNSQKFVEESRIAKELP